MSGQYARTKAALLQHLEEIAKIAGNLERGELAAYSAAVRENLRNDKFHLVVLGQFKRGKTTFINALLGENILPTAVVPLTSIVTLLEYGSSVRVEVSFLDGRNVTVPLSELDQYVTEEGNPQNSKQVRHVRISYPSQYLQDGVLLIDTPGVGSIYQNNTDETYRYLPLVDAAIFMLSADQPISQAEVEFLSNIKEYAQKTFFILNKIDYLADADRSRALDFVVKTLQDKVGWTGVKVFPLSARRALEGRQAGRDEMLADSGLPEFSSELATFLMQEKGRAVLAAAAGKGRSVLRELRNGVELELGALSTPLAELVGKIQLFDRMVQELEQEQQDNAYLLRGELDRLFARLEEEIKNFQEEQYYHITRKLEEFYRQNKAFGAKALLEQMEGELYRLLRQAFAEWQPALEKTVNESYNKLVARFVRKANRLVQQLVEQSASIFQVQVAGFSSVDALTAETRLYYKFGDDAALLAQDPLQVGALFLPRLVLGPLIWGRIKRRVLRELDKNCGRVRYDYLERVEKSAREFKELLEEKFRQVVDSTRQVLSRALSEKEKGEHYIGRREQELASLLRQIDALSSALDELAVTEGGQPGSVSDRPAAVAGSW